MIKLTWHWKVRDQIDTIERLGAKLTYGVKDMNQLWKKINYTILNVFGILELLIKK